MDSVEAMLHKGLSMIKLSMVNYLHEHHLNSNHDITKAISQSSVPWAVCWKGPHTSIMASMAVTAHHRYELWMVHMVFHGKKCPRDRDSDESDISTASPQSPEPGPSDTWLAHAGTYDPEGAVPVASHLAVSADVPFPGLTCSQQAETEDTGRTRWTTKRKVIDVRKEGC